MRMTSLVPVLMWAASLASQGCGKNGGTSSADGSVPTGGTLGSGGSVGAKVPNTFASYSKAACPLTHSLPVVNYVHSTTD